MEDMEEELVEEVDNDGGGNWRILRIWSLFDEIEFVTERNASYKKKKKKNQYRKKNSDLQKLDGYHLSEILWPCDFERKIRGYNFDTIFQMENIFQFDVFR